MAHFHQGESVTVLFAMLTDLPILDDQDRAIIQHSNLPNGMPVLLIHPANLPFLMDAAKRKSVKTGAEVNLVAIDLVEIFESDFVSPSAIPGMPETISLN